MFESLLQLEIGFHDYLLQSELPVEYREHRGSACMENKKKDFSTCVKSCGAGGSIDKVIHKHLDGWVMNCPHGLQKISIPFFLEGDLIGCLFGVARERQSTEWLEQRKEALLVLRSHILRSLSLSYETNNSDHHRAEVLKEFMMEHLEDDLCLMDVSKFLKLSPSHTSRWISMYHKQSFVQLLLSMRLRRAAMLLSQSDISITAIAQQMHFCDQSHFSKMFKRKFGMSPLKHRHQQRKM